MAFSARKSLIHLLLVSIALALVVWLISHWSFFSKPIDEKTRPNIVLITLDTTRVDHLSCYGYARKTSPNIDKLAEAGHKFTRAVSPSPWTLPAKRLS